MLRSFILILAVYLPLSAYAQPEIKLQTENFPPYNYSVEGKNFARGSGVAGICADIVREAFKRAQVPFSITLRFPWKRIYKKAAEKKHYGVFSMVRNDEREEHFHWIGPLAIDEWAIFAPSQTRFSIDKLSDIQHYKVGGYKGDALSNYLEEKGLKLLLSTQDKHNLKKLLDKRIDLWASNTYSARVLAKQEGVSQRSFRKVYTIDKVDLWLGLNKATDQATVNKLQAAIDSMKKDGTLEKLTNQYIQ